MIAIRLSVRTCLGALLLAAGFPVKAQPTAAVSSGLNPGLSAAGGSFLPVFSADGQHLILLSHAKNLVTNDNMSLSLNVFVHDIALDRNELVSVGVSGFGGGNSDATHPSISSNGQLIVFASRASNLVLNDTNRGVDVFVRKRLPQETDLVSSDLSGRSPFNTLPFSPRAVSGNPQISKDGRRVAFESASTNLTALPDNNGQTNDVFVRDLESGALSLVSVASDGLGSGNDGSHSPQISANGRVVGFISMATNLVLTGKTNNSADIYIRDVESGTIHWASPNTRSLLLPVGPAPASRYQCFNYSLSGDGQYVVYLASHMPMSSYSSNVLLYLQIVTTNTLRLATDADIIGCPQISFDGRFVAFSSRSNVHVWDRLAGSNTLVSVNTNGGFANGPSHSPVMSSDGRFIAFLSQANDLTTNVLASRFQIYVRDMVLGLTRLVSVNTNGEASAGLFEPSNVAMAPDGQLVAFDTAASDLVADDRNGASDVFLWDIVRQQMHLVSFASTVLPARTDVPMAGLAAYSVSADGRVVAFTSLDSPQIPDDTNRWQEIFVRDFEAQTLQRLNENLGPNAPRFRFATEPTISGAGDHMLYTVWAGGGIGGVSCNVFWHDRTTASNLLVGETPPLGARSSISSNGNVVIFQSSTSVSTFFTNVADGNGGNPDILARDMISSEMKLISINYAGTASGNGPSTNAVLSPDDRWVVFESTSTDLTESNSTSGTPSLFGRDLHSNRTEISSVGPDGNPQWGVRGRAAFSGNSRFVALVGMNLTAIRRDLELKTSTLICSGCDSLSLSGDGRFIAYERLEDIKQIYVTDMQSGIAKLISANLSGTNGNGHSTVPLITADGRFVVLQSVASDLVANDNNHAADIFVADRVLGTVVLLTVNYAGTESANGASSKPTLSADGRILVFQSLANDLIAGDYNDRRDVFVATLSAPDSDDDSMDDDFEVAYFGNLSRDGTGDADADGHTDLQEFLAGTNPTSDSSVLRVITLTMAGSGTKQIIWSTVAGRTYTVQYKDSLDDSWSALPGAVRAVASTASKADPTATPHRFYRVVLAQ